ncbi:MAG TPA: glycosyltransferase family 2 protein [Acidimicrobiales bacterium]|nr:glycosyltransferase family 2 protein [Acidimicrobiales bacterium]
MKVVIMIPCLNEEHTLPLVLETIPKRIEGIDEIDVLIIDDGSTDNTVAVAKRLGVTEFVHHPQNRGLAHSLRDGIQRALELGADILVLTDGDNQYPQERIPDLIRPIMKGEVDTVIADRQVQTIEHFSPMKKFLQRFGTGVMNLAAGTHLPDGTSGFRAYSKEAAIKLNLIGRFNFAAETTIQAANKRLAFATITIETNPKTRESRLFKSSWEHVRKSMVAMLNSFTMYRPYTVFLGIGGAFFILGIIPFAHYLYLVLTVKNPNGAHHLQSLVIGAVLLNVSFVSVTLGIVANLIRINRSLLEDTLEVIKRDLYK